MKTLSVYSWDPCDQYYQLTDRWGLVPASQLPVSALLSELETHVTGDHPDTLRKWLYPDTHTAYLSHHWYFRLLPPLYWYLISICRSQCNQTATVCLVWAPTLSPTPICRPSRLEAGQGAWLAPLSLAPPRPRPRLTSSAAPCPRIIMRNRQILGSTKVFKCSKIFKWILIANGLLSDLLRGSCSHQPYINF